MRNDTGFDDALAMLVEINPPGVAGPFGEQFEDVPGRVIAPHSRINVGSFTVGGAGLAHVGMREHSLAAVEPAVRAPAEGVQRFVSILIRPAIEQDLRRTRGLGFVTVYHPAK